MTRFCLSAAAMAVLVGGTGCYYGELQDCKRSLRITQEDLSRKMTELLDCEHMNKQKDTQIESLTNQNETKDRHIANLEAQVAGLEKTLADAQGIAKEMAGKQIGPLTIINRTLPPAVVNALQEFADKYKDILEIDPRTGAVRWKADLLFPLGSDQVATSEQIQGALRQFAEIVNSAAARDLELVIVGHTDTTRIAKPETLREHKTNWHLSTHRAIAVMRMLAGQGVIENRMGVMGYGELRPIADNGTPQGKTRNRRVEIFLVPKGSVTGTASPGVYNSDEAGTFVKPSDVGGTAPRSVRPAAPARAPTVEEPPPLPETPAPGAEDSNR